MCRCWISSYDCILSTAKINMKSTLLLIAVVFVVISPIFAQQTDSVNKPQRVVYNYTDPAVVEKAKQLIRQELLEPPTYQFNNIVVIVGPILWNRYKKIRYLKVLKKAMYTFRS